MRGIDHGLQAPHEILRLPDGQLARHHLLGCPDDRIIIFQGEERTRMAFAQASSTSNALTRSGSRSRRKMFATATRLFPTRSATSC